MQVLDQDLGSERESPWLRNGKGVSKIEDFDRSTSAVASSAKGGTGC